jgi:hypothetical protein
MFALLFDPVSEIKKAKKCSYAHILLYLVAASLFETAGLLFFGWRFFSTWLKPEMIAYGIGAAFLAIIIIHLVVAFFFTVAMHVLDGKGGYYEGLATLVLAMVAPAIATFFAGAATFVPYGSGAAAVMLSYGYILGTATLFRSGKEMFELDYAGVLIGFLITALTLGLASSFFISVR